MSTSTIGSVGHTDWQSHYHSSYHKSVEISPISRRNVRNERVLTREADEVTGKDKWK